MRFLLPLIFSFFISFPVFAENNTKLYRLDCGSIHVSDLNVFSDRKLYVGQDKNLVASCYLIQHGEHILLWDTGIDNRLIDKPEGHTHKVFTKKIKQTLEQQLAQIDLQLSDITHVAISHAHGDHSENVRLFEHAQLIIQKAEFEALQNHSISSQSHLNPENFKHFLNSDHANQLQLIDGDTDLFNDGSLQAIFLPGHTPGHMALMIDLDNAGKVILSGDQWHFSENRIHNGVPQFNYDANVTHKGKQTRLSSAKLEAVIRQEDALLIIQHEPKHVHRIPVLPGYLD